MVRGSARRESLGWDQIGRGRAAVRTERGMSVLLTIIVYLIFPGGLFVVAASLAYEYVDRKLVARFQNRVGPRWFQPLADFVKLLFKEEIVPAGVNRGLFIWLPVAALAAALAAALYVPMAGLAPDVELPGRRGGHRLPPHDDDLVHRPCRCEHLGPLLHHRGRPGA